MTPCAREGCDEAVPVERGPRAAYCSTDCQRARRNPKEGARPRLQRPAIPKGADVAELDMGPDGGTVTSGPVEARGEPGDLLTSWDWLLELHGLDPAVFEVIGDTVNARMWDAHYGKDQPPRKFAYYKATFRRRVARGVADYAALRKALLQRVKPRSVSKRALDDGKPPVTFVMLLADPQFGKGDGDGTPGTLQRVRNGILAAAEKIEEHRAAGWNIADALVAYLGDVTENVSGHYCVTVDTPILTDDLRWVPAGSLVVGSGLYAINEQQTGPPGRRYEKAHVTATVIDAAETVRVTFANGDVIECTPEHPFLVRREHAGGVGGKAAWVSARDLTPAHQAAKMFDVWDTGSTFDHGWLSGMYDGEGHFSAGSARSAPNILGIAQKPGAVLDRVSGLLGQFGYASTAKLNAGSGVVSIRTRGGYPEALRLLGSIRPNRLIAKVGEPWARAKEWAGVVSVEPNGVREIARMSTSSRTYFAGGYASHNSMQGFTADLGITEQIEAGTDMAILADATMLQVVGEVLHVAVPGNHGEVRTSGSHANTKLSDNYDVHSARQAAKVSRAAGHGDRSRWVFPEGEELSITLRHRGRIHTFLHGHAGKVNAITAHAKIVDWTRRQAFGLRAPGESEYVYSGHYHHASVVEQGRRVFVQAPALDGGSVWYAESAGIETPPGIFTALLTGEAGMAGLVNAHVLPGDPSPPTWMDAAERRAA